MRRVATVVAFAMALFVVQGVAYAQGMAGDQEFQVSGSVSTFITDDPLGGGKSTSTSGNFFFNVGHFVTNRFQLGGGPSVNITASNDTTHTDFGVNVFSRYFFGADDATVKPFLGADYSLPSLNPQDPTASATDRQFLAGQFGVRNYFSERAAIDFVGLYGFNPRHASELQIFQFRVGLTVLF